jgi:hypothetical protein
MIRLPKTFIRANKFNARKCSEDGYKFDSGRELKRYRELKLYVKAGHISNLEVHPIYVFTVNGHPICKMIPDFRYIEQEKLVVEDVKSPATITPVYRLKSKLLKALYGIDIKEILT